jgi:hypothetical protein
MPLTPPAHGRVVDCRLHYNATCSVVCNEGYAASGGLNASDLGDGISGSGWPTVLRCDAFSKSWEGSVPQCDECVRGYYKQGRACLPCVTSECPPGKYRAACTRTADAPCVPCSAPLPANAYYASGGSPYYQNNCIVACVAGFYMSSNGSACIPEPRTTPTLTYAARTQAVVPLLSEAYKQAGILTVPFSLTVAPTSAVYVTVTVSRQLVLVDQTGQRRATPSRSTVLTFTHADYGIVQNVSLDAWDDLVYEGVHSGLVYYSLSSADPAYDLLQVRCAEALVPRAHALSSSSILICCLIRDMSNKLHQSAHMSRNTIVHLITQSYVSTHNRASHNTVIRFNTQSCVS